MISNVVSCLLVITLVCQTDATPQLKVAFQPIQCVDESGKPVEGANAQVVLFNEKYMLTDPGLEKIQQTKAEGICRVQYPQIPNFPIETVTVQIAHPDFREAQAAATVDAQSDKPFVIKLQKGIKLSIHALDPDGNSTKIPFGIMISGNGGNALWRRPEPHMAISGGIASGNRQLMLIQQRSDGQRLFSDVLTQQFSHEKEAEVTLEDVELRLGTQCAVS